MNVRRALPVSRHLVIVSLCALAAAPSLFAGRDLSIGGSSTHNALLADGVIGFAEPDLVTDVLVNASGLSAVATDLTLQAHRDLVQTGSLNLTQQTAARTTTLRAGRNLTLGSSTITLAGAAFNATAGDAGGLGDGSAVLTLNGSVATSGTATFTNAFPGGIVLGAGTYSTTGAVIFAGDVNYVSSRTITAASVTLQRKITPAASVAATLAINGAATLSATSTLRLRTFAGSSCDQLDASGALTLGGALEVNPGPGMTYTLGQSFKLLDWGTRSGTFASVTLPTLPNNLIWDTSRLYSEGIVAVAAPSLAWDPGTADAGTTAIAQPDTAGGSYYFKVHTQSSALGVWRTRLAVTSGEANLYLAEAPTVPTTSSSVRSVLTGSDEVTLFQETATFKTDRDYYILVSATAGAQWTLVSGQPWVNTLPDPDEVVSGETVSPGSWRFFRANLPAAMPGWRLVLGNPTGQPSPDLYVRRGAAAPNSGNFTKNVINAPLDTLFFVNAESTAGEYILGVFGPSSATAPIAFTLTSETGWVRDLTWDPGMLDDGTAVHTNTSLSGGEYYFRLRTQDGTIGAWRTRLSVGSGEANLAIKLNAAPYTDAGNWSSNRVGSDGVAVQRGNYTSNADYYLRVTATPGAAWTLFSGEAYARTIHSPNTSSPTPVWQNPFEIPPEGVAIFRTQASSSATVPAWRLWAYRRTGDPDTPGPVVTMTNPVVVRRSLVGFPGGTGIFGGTYDLKQNGQMLVVPTYLGTGSDTYFISIFGAPDGFEYRLDSRPHQIRELSFNGTQSVAISNKDLPDGDVTQDDGFAYRTFKVDLEISQFGWEVNTIPNMGDPGVAVRRNAVPNEWNNDAFSEAVPTAIDSITLASPTLVDGTWYVTVYGTAAFNAQLQTRSPLQTNIAYTDTANPTDPTRSGWHYFCLGAGTIPDQSASLGLQLALTNEIAGREIAVRRNNLPVRWYSRSNNSSTVQQNSNVDASSTNGFLQRQAQAADIWYVGVHLPNQAVGNFTLTSGPIAVGDIALNGGSVAFGAALRPQEWQYVKLEIPTNPISSGGNQTLRGWQVRLVEASSNSLSLSVRRDMLPMPMAANVDGSDSSWPSGEQLNTTVDMTGRAGGPPPSSIAWEGNNFTLLAATRPLQQPGSYYVGVRNTHSSNTATYRIETRAVFDTAHAGSYDITPLSFTGTSGAFALAARGVRIFSVEIPAGTPSWRFRLNAVSGEGRLYARRDVIPGTDVTIQGNPLSFGAGSQVATLNRSGGEVYTMLPANGQTSLPVGTYYLAAVSEGQSPANSSSVGTGESTLEVVSEGVAAIVTQDLGDIPLDGSVRSHAGTFPRGEPVQYNFNILPGTESLVVKITNQSGSVASGSLLAGTLLPALGGYGIEGGLQTGSLSVSSNGSPRIVAAPAVGPFRLLVGDLRNADTHAAGNYTVEVYAIGVIPLTFPNAEQPMTNHPPGEWRYFRVDASTDPTLRGWEARLLNPSHNQLYLSIRRDALPPTTNPIVYGYLSSWPTLGQLNSDSDLTQRTFAPYPSTLNEAGNYVLAATGWPLQSPGQYFIGVQNNGSTAASYTLRTRGVYEAATPSPDDYEITSIPFAGGSSGSFDLPARGLRFFKVVVPAGTGSARFRLNVTSGEARLYGRSGVIPGTSVSNAITLQDGSHAQLNGLNHVGSEVWSALPRDSEATIPAGTYHFVAVSEGQSPFGTSYIGTGSSTMEFVSEGEFATAATIPFADANPIVTDHPPLEWRFYRVDVASDATLRGWQVFLTEQSHGSLDLVVRRDLIPTSTGASLFNFGSEANWASGHKIIGTTDFTDRSYAPYPTAVSWEGTNHLLVASGRPFQTPGTYYLGVYNSHATTSASYRLRTRTVHDSAVGGGFGIEALAFAGGSSGEFTLPARGLRFFKVEIADNTPSWRVRLSCTSGEANLRVRFNAIPGTRVDSSSISNPVLGGIGYQSPVLNRTGGETYVILPAPGQTKLPVGTYYLAVAAEGQNPQTSSYIGTSSSSMIVTSDGVLPVETLPTASTTEERTALGSYPGGDTSAYQIPVPAGAYALELRLDDRVGAPRLHAVAGAQLPASNDFYGLEGGVASGALHHDSLINVRSPLAGSYSLLVRDSRSASSTPPGTFTLRARLLEPAALNLSASQNPGGGTNSVTGMLVDQQRTYYRVDVPAGLTLGGQPLLGWKLTLGTSQGSATLRVHYDFPTLDTGINLGTGAHLITTPYLRPGTWYLEVTGTGATTFTLTSERAELTTAPWSMPATGGAAGTFGDSGASLPGDGGRDLASGDWDYFAVDVPADNAGLLRTELQAINGNPDLYLRPGTLPSIDHATATPWYVPTSTTSAYQRSLTGTGTEYGDWVPLNSTDFKLTPGLHYLGVKATGSNVRYRLLVSSGNSSVGGLVQPLPLSGGNLVNQVLAAKDWRYYRVALPLDAPNQWKITFTQVSGDVVLYLRDTVPPGHGTSVTDYINDQRDTRPVTPSPYNFDAPGTYTLTTPPLRPETNYYVGVRAVSDAQFTISSAVAGGTIGVPPTLDFFTGSISGLSLPAGGNAVYRVAVPGNAGRWKHTSTHTTGVRVSLQNGTLPVYSTAQWQSGAVANSALTRDLTSWPWWPGFTYYLLIENTSGATQSFSLQMAGEQAFPAFTTQPANVTQNANTTATFTIAASGTPTPTLQWQISTSGGASWTNLSNLAGQVSGATTATLSLQSIDASDAALYRCVASNSSGSTASSAASLTVNLLAQTITFPAIADRGINASPFTPTKSASSGLPVTLSVVSGPATVSGDSVTLTGGGLVTLRASQPGNSAYLPATPVDRSFNVTVPNFASWAAVFFTAAELADPAISGPLADYNGDGAANLVHYALGIPPGVPIADHLPAPAVQTLASPAGTYLTLGIRRPKPAPGGIVYGVEEATIPGAWTSVPLAANTVTTIDHGDGTETLVIRASAPVGASARQFLRFIVTTTP